MGKTDKIERSFTMTEETKQKLEELANDRLNRALSSGGDDEDKNAFCEGMEAIDKLTRLEQQHDERVQRDNADTLGLEKLEADKEQNKQERKVHFKDVVGWGLKIVEIAAIPVALCLLNSKSNERQLDKINEFEGRDETYTSTGGRSVGKSIKWK